MMKKNTKAFVSYLALTLLALLIFHSNSQANFLPTASTTQFTNAFFPGGIFGNIGKNSDISQYQGVISIKLDSGQNTYIKFWAYFTPDSNNCRYKKCFIGWIGKYETSDQQTIQGYPGSKDTDSIQPIFQFDTNSQDDYSISYSDSLDSTWSSLIDYACEQFNPFDGDPATSTKFKFASTTNLRGSNISSKIGSLSTNLKLNDTELRQSLLRQSIQLDPQNNILFKRTQDLDLELDSDKSAIESGETPDLKAKISTTLTFTKKITDSKLISGALEQLKDEAKDTRGYSKYIIQNKRNINLNDQLNFEGSQPFIQRDQEPKIQTFDQKTILPGQTTYDIDIAQQIQKGSDQLLDIKSQPASANDLSFSIDLPNIQLNDIGTGLPETSTFQFNALSDATTTAKILPIRLLAAYPITKTILSYTKTLYSKTILGKTVSLKIYAYCQLIIYSNVAYINCKANLIYSIFGKTKTLTIYSLLKKLNSNWSWSKNYSGNWDFYVSVRFPPPFSFASLNFYIKINYYFKVNLNILKISSNPYTVRFKALIETGINTDSKATIRVVIVQLGVFIKGTLVSIGTDPTLTMKFLFSQHKLIVTRQWYFWIIAFRFEWGFIWRRRKLFGGWTSWKIIKKWNVNGIYKKYTIINNTSTYTI